METLKKWFVIILEKIGYYLLFIPTMLLWAAMVSIALGFLMLLVFFGKLFKTDTKRGL